MHRRNLSDNLSKTKHTSSRLSSFISSLWPFGAKKAREAISIQKPVATQMSVGEEEILNNLLNFDKKTVEDVMIPRSDICAVNSSITLDGLNNLIVENSHTRTIVYDDNLDNIIGFVHIKDLFKIIANKKPFDLRKILRKPIIAPQSMRLIDLLTEMQKKRTHIAVVVDEYGGTDGMVTIEDVIEEIVGQINDEHDKNVHDSYQIVNSETILSNARVKVKELEKVLGVPLSSDNDEFDTIGGMVLAKMGSVPAPGTVIDISDSVKIEVMEASPRSLKQVRIKLKGA